MIECMNPRTEQLLRKMFYKFSKWRPPSLDFKSRSAGFETGGRVVEISDWEDEIDDTALKVIETAWWMLGDSERISVEQAMGRLARVATVREGVLEGAVRRIELKLYAEGIL